MAEWYRPLLAVHVIAIISWMAGILYLYHLLVYAAERGQKAEIHALLSLMSRRLYRAITFPAMVVAWFLGLTLILLNPGLLSQSWMHLKLISIILLTGFTFYAGVLTAQFGRGEALPSGKTLRFLNEVPTLLMVVIVVMVIVRPFV